MPTVVFDLDRTLIDSRRAWCYSLEESVLATCGTRISAGDLYDEYHTRPIRDAVSLLMVEHDRRLRCEALVEQMSRRSALKRLLVFDGIGMVLDELRGARVEVGAISRLPHSVARKQVDSTGLDRFLSVLESTAADEDWRPAELLRRCARFLEVEERRVGYIGTGGDVAELQAGGQPAWNAGWCGSGEARSGSRLAHPRELLALVGLSR